MMFTYQYIKLFQLIVSILLIAVMVELNGTVPQGMMGMYDGSAPASWQIVTGFDKRFPYGTSGSPPPGTTGGDSVHTHSAGAVVVGEISGPIYGADGTDVEILRTGHDHVVNINVNSSNHLPLYRTTAFISAASELSSVPQGLILIFDNTPPAGWTIINNFEQRFPRGNSDNPGVTGGNSCHRHIIGDLGLPSNYFVEDLASGPIGGSTVTHVHDSINSVTADNLPPYIDLIFASAPSGLSDIPVGAIAMFDAEPSGSGIGTWELYTLLDGRFPRGTTDQPGGTGGTSSHNHSGLGMSSQSTGGSAFFQSAASGPSMSLDGHVHAIQVTTDDVSLLPPYRTVYFYKKTGPTGIEMNTFSASTLENCILLAWRTESENDISEFILERSLKSGKYQRIARIHGSDPSPSPQSYSYRDENVKSGTRYYYKLGAVKINGTTKWYGPVSAVISDIKPSLSIYPNPFFTSTTIFFSLPSIEQSTEDIGLNIYDVSGRLVKDFSLFSPHSSPITKVSWDGTDNNGKKVPPGAYFIHLSIDNYKEIRKVMLVR
jgi:hypothetical protein